MPTRCTIVAFGRRVTYTLEVEHEELDVEMKTADEVFACRTAGEDLTIASATAATTATSAPARKS